MATYKTKVKDLKNISNKTDIGGAPFFGDDILGLQINAKADFINTNENLRRRLPIYEYYRTATTTEKMHGSGLILSGLNYNNATASAVTVSSGFVLLEGEICFYAGGTFDCSSGSAQKFLYLGKGSATTESRVFADGSSKEFKVEFGVNATLSDTGANGPTTEPLASADLTKDFVFITLGAGASFAGETEKYFTVEAARGLIGLGSGVSYPKFLPFASFGANWTGTNPFNSIFPDVIGSRLVRPGVIEIRGTCTRTVTGGSGIETIGTLQPGTFSIALGSRGAVNNSYPLPHMASDSNTNATYFSDFYINLGPTGNISIGPRGGSTGTFPTGVLRVTINAIIYDSRYGMQHEYVNNNKFMDITP